MAIPWLTMLKIVPWGDVIGNAPKVADGAKKLWSAVGRKPEPAAPGASVAGLPPESRTIAELQARLDAVEATTTQLHGQMVASTELIQALAEQNTQLIARIEAHRIRLAWLVAATAVAGVAAIAAWAAVLVR